MSKNAKITVPEMLPPHDGEAELGVLGCCLLEPAQCLNECEERGVTQGWFYDLRFALIYAALTSLHKAGAAVDVITLQHTLNSAGHLEEVGGLTFLATLTDRVPSAANLEAYLEILRDKYLLRRLLATCAGACLEVKDNPGRVDDLLGRVEREILKLGEGRSEMTEVRLKQIVLQVMSELEDYHRGKPQLKGITTGLEYVDKLLCGIGGRQGNYMVLGGRPGTGKTSLAMQIAMHAALDYVWFEPVVNGKGPVMETVNGKERFKVTRQVGVPVGIFTLEMASDALVERMLFQQAEADLQRWRTGFAEGDAAQKIVKAAARLTADNIFIDDAGRCTIESLRAKARRMARQYGIKLFVIDYIQLMRSSAKRFREDRVQELSDISSEIQGLGKELQVPIIVLAQMNRDYEKEPNRKPRLSDLKDCGSIEQDADLVGFLYTPKMRDSEQERYDRAMEAVYKNDWSKYPVRVDLIWPKNRYGPTGNSQLLFQRSCTRFMDYNVWLKSHGHKEAAKGERGYGEGAAKEEEQEWGEREGEGLL